MIQTIRNALPNITADQEMLIGESCLTLTNEERTAINRINFTEYSRTETRNGKLIADIVSEAIFSAKQTGAIGGAGIGAIGGAGMGYLLNDKITGEAVSSGAIGGVLGGAAGYKFGSHIWEKMERDRLIADITNSPEYRAWIFPKFKEVFPVLGQFMKANEWNNISLECPIAQDWMTDPIQTPDGCMYERRSIEDWLAQWDRLWTPERLAELTDVQRSEARLARSPLRNRDISLAGQFMYILIPQVIFRYLHFLSK